MPNETDRKTTVGEAEARARIAEIALEDVKKSRLKLVIGAIALTAVLIVFGARLWPGYMLTTTAEQVASDRAEAALKTVAVNVLAPLCAERARGDPDETKLRIVGSMSFDRQKRNEILKMGFGDFDGIKLTDANKWALGTACVELLFPK